MKQSKKTQISILFTIMILTSSAFTLLGQADSKALISMNNTAISTVKNDSAFLNASGVLDLMGSCEVNISWDPDVVSVVDVIGVDVDSLYFDVDNDVGLLSLIAISIGGLSGEFVIAEIVFEAVGDAGDSCDLIIEESELLTADPSPAKIEHDRIDGKANIVNENNSGSSNDGNSGTNGGTPIDTNYVIANASLSETIGFVGVDLLFDGSKSSAEGNITSYDWDFNDGKTGTGITIYHNFSTAGIYLVTLSVTDNNGATDTDTITVTISQSENYSPKKPVLIGPSTGKKNNVYDFTVLSTDTDNDTICYHVEWGDGTMFTTPFVSQNTSITLNYSWVQSGRYIITITADDNNTLSENLTHVFLVDAEELYYGEQYLGYITDENNDGTFDTYEHKPECIMYSEDLQLYLIDYDADGIWDYTYDSETKAVAKYHDSADNNEKTNNTTDDNDILLYGLFFIILLGVIFFISLRKKFKK